MAFAAAPLIGAGISGIASLFGANNAKNAQKAQQDQTSAFDNQLLGIYNTELGDYNQNFAPVASQGSSAIQQMLAQIDPSGTLSKALGFAQQEQAGTTTSGQEFSNEATGGLDPAVTAASNANLKQQQAQGISNVRNSLGPALPNLGGKINDLNEQGLVADVSQNLGLAAQNQGVRNAGATSLSNLQSAGNTAATGIAQTGLQQLMSFLGIGNSLLPNATQGIGGLATASGAGAAASGAAASSGFANGLGSLATLLPTLFGGGTTAPVNPASTLGMSGTTATPLTPSGQVASDPYYGSAPVGITGQPAGGSLGSSGAQGLSGIPTGLPRAA